jgi:hypothetical protein
MVDSVLIEDATEKILFPVKVANWVSVERVKGIEKMEKEEVVAMQIISLQVTVSDAYLIVTGGSDKPDNMVKHYD